MEDRKKLSRALDTVRNRIRLKRGRGSLRIGDALRSCRGGEEVDLGAVAEVIESLCYAVEDAEREATQNLRVTSRTISHAIRGGLRG